MQVNLTLTDFKAYLCVTELPVFLEKTIQCMLGCLLTKIWFLIRAIQYLGLAL